MTFHLLFSLLLCMWHFFRMWKENGEDALEKDFPWNEAAPGFPFFILGWPVGSAHPGQSPPIASRTIRTYCETQKWWCWLSRIVYREIDNLWNYFKMVKKCYHGWPSNELFSLTIGEITHFKVYYFSYMLKALCHLDHYT